MGLRIVFVLSPHQNVFFVEIAEALGSALDELGVAQCITTEPGEHVVGEGDVFVLLPPHEYIALEGDSFVVAAAVARRTIGVSAEQPHQSFFERNAAIGARLGAVLDFSTTAVEAYRRLGVHAEHMQFGHVPSWDRVSAMAGSRQVETPVLYMGNNKERRLAVLAEAADVLAENGARVVVGDNSEPNRATDPGFFSGDRKRDLLASSGLVVNIHQSNEPYFEWLRFADATHCGAPMLTERSAATDPFRDGEHFLSFDRLNFAETLHKVARDQARLHEVAAAAYQRLVEHPLSRSVIVLVETATSLLSEPPPARLPARTRSAPIGRDRTMPEARLDPSPGRLARLRSTFRPPPPPIIVEPGETTWRCEPESLLVDAAPARFVSVMTNGLDAAGQHMIEGLWGWEPWRLLVGQHLGRTLVVERQLEQRARAWLSERLFDAHPHVRVQLFAAVHGMAGAHVACPMATSSVVIEPSHDVPAEVAERCRQILSGSD